MKKYAFSFVLLFCTGILQAADWVYFKNYPWVWESQSGWTYIPKSSSMVWSWSEGGWIESPYSTFLSLEGIPNSVPLDIKLTTEAGIDIVITVNLSGPEYGYLSIGGQQYQVVYEYSIDPIRGTALVFVQSLMDAPIAASVSLCFAGESDGNFTLIGNLGISSSIISVMKGDFVLK